VANIAAVFSPVTGNPVNPTTTTDSGNLATTSRKFVKASVKCRTSELQSIAVFRDYHANHRGVNYGIRDQKAKKQLLQVCEHIINDDPAARPKWAKVPITFTQEDFRLKSAIHNDAMVIKVNIAGWVIGKVLVDKEVQQTSCS
jgi:hypothetical protein